MGSEQFAKGTVGTVPFSALMVRLGAMGDILHALPSLSSLRASFPQSFISWVVAPKWRVLLEGNPAIDQLLLFRRSTFGDLLSSWRMLRQLRPAIAIDFQGLMQSALVGRVARPGAFFGLDSSHARERWASVLYSKRVCPRSVHVVDQNLELAAAAGASTIVRQSFIPPGHSEGTLPSGPFVLTHPLAGWTAKQWPLENYGVLATMLAPHGISLVANVPPQRAADIRGIPGLLVHTSSLSGLIDATRRAAAVVGLDSGPMHLAAALTKRGIALFGPTDPARNGPYGGSMVVLRSPEAVTSYKRRNEIDPSMRRISPTQVYEALLPQLNEPPGSRP